MLSLVMTVYNVTVSVIQTLHHANVLHFHVLYFQRPVAQTNIVPFVFLYLSLLSFLFFFLLFATGFITPVNKDYHNYRADSRPWLPSSGFRSYTHNFPVSPAWQGI